MKNAIETQSEATKRETERLNRVADSKAYTVPPCPGWCKEAAGHDYDSIDPGNGGALERHHSWDAPDIGEQHHAWASISACEVSLDGVVTLKAPYIYASADEELTARQARAYSAELLLAANKLDEINGAK